MGGSHYSIDLQDDLPKLLDLSFAGHILIFSTYCARNIFPLGKFDAGI